MRSLANWCYDHNRTTVVGWIVAVIITIVAVATIGGTYSDDFSLPGTESQRAQDVLESKFPAAKGDTSQLVFHVDRGALRDKRNQVEAVVAKVRQQPTIVKGKEGVTDPFSAATVSKDGRTAFATITHTDVANKLEVKDIQKVIDAAESSDAAKTAKKDGVQIEMGGIVVQTAEQNESGIPVSELIGIVLGGFLIFFVLRAVSTVFIPLIAAVIAILIAEMWTLIAANFFSIPDFTSFLIPLIGLGVGIDYGLLTLNRVRSERAHGHDMRDSVANSLDTAGRSITFAGTTVIIALCGMLLLGLSFLNGPALGPAFAVFLTVLTTLTLVPALLASRPFHKRLKPGTDVDPDTDTHFWARFGRFSERHPIALGIVGIVILLIVMSPVLNMRQASGDAGNGPKDNTSRKAYDLLAQGFGPGFNGPFLAVVEVSGSKADANTELQDLKSAYAKDPGVASVGEPTFNEAGDTAILQVTPKSKPQDESTKQTLNRLRDQTTPETLAGTNTQVSIGGFTASTVDFARVLEDKLPVFIAVVVGLSLILLMIVFRSIAIPIKAGICNLLSIGTALGVVTWVFQDGHLLSLIGVSSPIPIEPFLPVFMFAIIFGLSMDYEVFLVTRMHEEWEHNKSAKVAVRRGLAHTGKVITVAALVMMAVFSAFILEPDPVAKLFGVGFVAAIFFDAFVIRMLIVPSVMFLLDRSAWWIPGWLDKILPRVSIEGPEDLTGTSATKTD